MIKRNTFIAFITLMFAIILAEDFLIGEIKTYNKDLVIISEILSVLSEIGLWFVLIALLVKNHELKKTIKTKNEEIIDLSRRVTKSSKKIHCDELTGLLNRNALQEWKAISLKMMDYIDLNCTTMFIDIDKFKNINDKYGHKMGDEILKQFAEVLKESCGCCDFIGRLGGEEFIAVSFKEGCVPFEVAQKIQEEMKRTKWKHGGKLTCSIGISSKMSFKYFDKTLIEADEYMYKAKELGRNRIVKNTDKIKEKHV